MLAAICYGVNSIVSKLVPKINFISLATGTTMASTIIISPFAFFYEPFWLESFTSSSTIAIVIQGLFATAIANLLFFKIMADKARVIRGIGLIKTPAIPASIILSASDIK